MTPKDWSLKLLGEVLECLDNKRVPINDTERQTLIGDVPYYGANGLQGYINDYIFDEPLILLAEDGGHYNEYQTRPIAYKITGKSWVNNHAHVLRAPNPADIDWFYYSLVHKDIRKHVNTGTRGKLNRADMNKIPLLIPPAIERRKIATILASVDDAIERTQSLIAQLGRVKQALLRNIVCRGLPGAHQRFRKIKDLREIPNDWTVVNLGDIAEKVTSGSRGWAEYYADEGKLFLRITNLTRDSITPDLSDIRYVMPPQGAEGSRTKVQTGDLLVSITADLGIIGRIPDGYPEAYINQHIALVRLKPSAAMPDWVALFLASPVGQIQFQRLNDPGAKAGLNLESIRRLTVVLPSLAEQQRIAALINGTDQATVDEMSMLEQLKVVKSGLMHVLLSGKKPVLISTPHARTA